MKEITVRLPLKNENYDGFSTELYQDYKLHANGSDTIIEIENMVAKWVQNECGHNLPEGFEIWPYKIISIKELTGYID